MADFSRGPVTASDLVAEKERRLREDPEYRAAVEKDTAERAERTAARRLASVPVLDDLERVGVEIDNLYLLYKHPEKYSVAIPVLLEHLRRDYSETTLNDIGSALPFKPAAEWWDDFKALYLVTSSDAVRDRLAAALGNCAVRKHYEDLLGFIQGDDLGSSRIYFLRPINRIGNRMEPGKGRAVIESLATHETLGSEAQAILAGRSNSQ